ncbi:hypothetical protein B7P43_G17911 [Cryptotermes secundus]|uniref:Uncharacterized protein n=1 Tax=Cryptotermes secundus TaxID=105785 RepID=A0A2J7Q052_9NEOP|nr:hypothetical protein B7P43_G17911 [Cryptotermes secundus]
MQYSKTWITAVWIVWSWGIRKTNASTEELRYSVDRYDELPGIYYENLGEVNLFNTEWKTVVYLKLLKDLIGSNPSHSRRRQEVFNFIGEISKVLFGTMDSDDAEYYNEQIRHIAQVNNALNAMQRNLDLLIESILNAQKGVLHLQIVSPSLIIESLKKSIPFFPEGTLAPFSLIKALPRTS